MRNDMTLVNNGAWGTHTSHRRGSFKKVENGFVLKLAVSKKVPDEQRGAYGEKHVTRDEEYVFYSVEEFILALTNYLNAGKEEIRGD